MNFTRSKILIGIYSFGGCLACSMVPSTLAVAASSGELATVKDSPLRLESFHSHSRLVLRIDETVEPAWQSTPDGFELLLKGYWLSDLGAPLGEEQAWAEQWARGLKDQRLARLTLKETREGLVLVGKWKFPEGKNRPFDPKMERFDFREKDPPRYLVDFWHQKGPTVAQVEAIRLREKREQERKHQESLRKQRLERKIASDKARAEAEDLTRSCRLPLTPENDLFLPFLPVHDRPDLNRYLSIKVPDEDWVYPVAEVAKVAKVAKVAEVGKVAEGDRPEAKYIKLAVNLYQTGNPALAIRTIDFYYADYPVAAQPGKSASDVDELLRFLRANALLKLGHAAEAESILKELARFGKKGDISYRSALYLAVKAYQRPDATQALEAFTDLAQKYPDQPLAWVFHWVAAESLYQLNYFDRAAKEYQWVAMNAPDAISRSQGAFRLGDLYLVRQQHERALATYFQGLKRHEKEAENFPNVHLNRAEALYWVEDFERASAAFHAFLERYPSHSAGWRAMLRLAEISARSPKPEDQARARAQYLETINRFPLSPGATLARMRVLPCGDHGGFDLAAAEAFFEKDVKNFKANADGVVTERFADFRALTRVQTLVALAPPEKVTDITLEELKAPLSPSVKERLVSTLGEVFRRSILDLMAKNQPFQALQFYEARVSQLPKLETEPDYLLKLSQAASDLGFGRLGLDLAQKYADVQADAIKRGRALATVGAQSGGPGLQNSRDSKDSKDFKDSQDLEARLKKSEADFTQAKALWMALAGVSKTEASEGASKPAVTSGGAGSELEAKLQQIEQLLSTIPEEALFAYERELILGQLAERSGRSSSALSHALKAQLLRSAADASDGPRVDYWVARLQAVAGSRSAAAEGLRKLQSVADAERTAEGKAQLLGLGPVPPRELLIMAESELLVAQEKWGKAAEAYGRAVEAGLGGNRALYEYARAVKRNPAATEDEKTKALEALKKAASSQEKGFWGNLAKELLVTLGESSADAGSAQK